MVIPSVLWRCWLGGRKGIQPVKNWVVGYWRSYLSGARCRLAHSPADATATHCLLLSLAPVGSRLVLPFWCWLTWVVPEKGPLNGCVCVWTSGSRDMFSDRHIHTQIQRQRDTLITILCSPIGDGVTSSQYWHFWWRIFLHCTAGWEQIPQIASS